MSGENYRWFVIEKSYTKFLILNKSFKNPKVVSITIQLVLTPIENFY